MASMGSVAGEKITRAIEMATRKKLPLIIFHQVVVQECRKASFFNADG